MRMIPGADVQAAIAGHVLGDVRIDEALGDVTLHTHQREGAARARHLLQLHGGALISDDVGLGKTYLALAIARGARRPVVVAPAALRANWEQAALTANVLLPFYSIESLARGQASGEAHDLVVIDEAQHLRNPQTRGFAACRALCATAKVLLLSATPVQNRVEDLRTILSLFLGERANSLPVESLASFIVRRDIGSLGDNAGIALPAAESPKWLSVGDDADCLERIVSLPPPLTAADAGDGGALLTYTLVRQWASSRAALRSALSRRIARACALEDSLAEGRLPTRGELAAWTFAGGAQQLAFPLMAATTVTDDAVCLLDRVRRHRDAVRELAAWLGSTPDPDEARAARLRELFAAHPGRRIVAFSEYADTVSALYRLVTPHLRVAMLTHAGGRVAGGRTSRRDLLAAFAPGSRERVHDRDRVDLLLTTDVLSEGVGLQDASVVVHLDLPWNPARLTQRVGRVRRIGSSEASVLVFAMLPPAPAEQMLELERRLRRKVSEAARAVGVADEVLPGISTADESAATRRSERRATALRGWAAVTGAHAKGGPVCGAVRASRSGALACVRVNGSTRLIAFDGRIADDADTVDEFIRSASRESVTVDVAARDAVVASVSEWLGQRQATGVVDLTARRVAQSRRALIRRTERIAQATPRHARASVSPLLFAARNAATAPLSAGAERVLEELTNAPLSDEAWLRALGEFSALHAGPAPSDAILAVLLLTPATGPEELQ
jgi:superfamily II DNA or RNA helicase